MNQTENASDPPSTNGSAPKAGKQPLERGSLQRILLDALEKEPKGLSSGELARIGVASGSTAKSVSVALPRMRRRGLIKKGGNGYVAAAGGGAKAAGKGAKAAAPKRGPGRPRKAEAQKAERAQKSEAAEGGDGASTPKQGRWKPGALQEAILVELRKGPHSRSELYRKFPTTGRTSIVAALKSTPGISQRDGVYSITGTGAQAPAAPAAQPVKRGPGRPPGPRAAAKAPAPAAKPARAARESADTVAGLLAEFGEHATPGTADHDLQAAVAISQARALLEGLPEERRSRIMMLASLLAGGRISLR